jgi:hypothetical protein
MTDIFWASVIMTPVALALFIPSVTYVYLALSRRSLRVPGARAFTDEDILQPQLFHGDVLISLFFAVLAQLVALSLILSGLGDDPYAPLALVCGVSEWSIAIAWVGLLITRSSPRDKPS